MNPPDNIAPPARRSFGHAAVDLQTYMASFVPRIRVALEGTLTIVSEVDRGGSALVFHARETGTNRDVALKVMRPDLSAALDTYRFQREIEIAGRLQHPNILPVIQSGVADGSLFYTMPFVPGGTLRSRLGAQGPFSIADTVRVARDIALALDHAHAVGVIHRDIKPANVLLDGSTTLVADFGIARAMTVATGDTITESGVSIGTPEYMSPEQGLGEKNLTASSDIYALGCVVYEMLAGEAPFTGPTAQAIIARHCHETPRSIRVIRPSMPYGVERAVMKALAKTPVDRFETAGAFVDALEHGISIEHAPAKWRMVLAPRRAVASVVAATAIVAILAKTLGPDTTVYPNRVVVFPLYDASAPAGSTDAEGVATYIGNALGNAPPLTWVDGWELTRDTPANVRMLPRTAARLSRGRGARYFIEGLILRGADSTRIALTLYDAVGDSAVATGTAAAPARAAILPILGIDAVSKLLPSLVSPGGKVSIESMSRRNPRAIANFLQGEREYRRMQFQPALGHYQEAFGEDSALTLAAMRGAHAAKWESEPELAIKLADEALRSAATLPAAQAKVARGLRAMLGGDADSAVAHFQEALRIDPATHGAYTLLGETYLRMLPNAGPADSLARDALEKARREDADFAPTLLLLETMALNEGRLREASLLAADLRRAGADTSHELARRLARECVRGGPAAVDFHAALRQDKLATITAAKMLDGTARQPICAIAAYTAVIDAADVEPNYRWAAFLGLQSQFAATARPSEAAAVFAWKGTENLPRRYGYLLAGSAGAGFFDQAAAVADTAFRQGYGRLSATTLWMVGTWETRVGNADRVRELSRVLRQRADSTRLRRDALLAKALEARVRLVDGDTVGAITRLRALRPNATQTEISWSPWESLGAERMLLAELLMARRDYVEARKVAALLDAPEPVIYPMYLRSSLELRVRSAEATDQPSLVAMYRSRLAELSRTRSR
jgi:tetratricopeptide (TPR) repeat protein